MNIEKPNRIKHSYEQLLIASPDSVFPLLCPVAEEKWVPGWKAEKVISESGVIEQDCIFITPAEPHNAIWVVSKYAPDKHQLEMYKVTPEHTIGKLEISLISTENNTTKATISYEFTAIGDAGHEFLKGFTDEWYKEFMKNWEAAMNHYLRTGEKLDKHPT